MIIKINYLLEGNNNKWELKKHKLIQRLVNWIIQSKKTEKEKKIIRDSETCGIPSSVSIYIIGISEERKKKERNHMWIKNGWKLPKFKIQESQTILCRINWNRSTYKHIMVKLSKDKEWTLKAARERKQINSLCTKSLQKE